MVDQSGALRQASVDLLLLGLLIMTLQTHPSFIWSQQPKSIYNQTQQSAKMMDFWKNVMRLTRIERVTFRYTS